MKDKFTQYSRRAVIGMTLTLGACKTPRKGQQAAVSPLGPGQPPQAGLPGPSWQQAQGNAPTSVGTRDTYSKISTSLPLLALTFDDGPHPTLTPRLLDILKARNVKATFYVVGTRVKSHPEILRRMIAEGHEIGNHTVNHPNLAKLSPDGVRRELRETHQAIVSATGVPPRTMRPPYGAITSEQKSWIRQEFGYPTIMWNVDPLDWKRPGASVVASRLVSGAGPGAILLAHDIHSGSIDATPSVVDQLLKRGFQFLTVTQLLAMDGKG